MSSIAPGWAVELVGGKIDIDDLREQLSAPFNPYIVDYSTVSGLKPLLRSEGWAKLAEAADVHDDAVRIMQRVIGAALLIHNDALPVGLGAVMRFGPDETLEPVIFAAKAHAVGRARMRGRGAAITDHPPAGPKESTLQGWLRQAEIDATRADLFTHLSRADNWYDLYKVAELARRLAGSEAALQAALGSDWSEWKCAWQMANCHRHAPDPVKFPLPNPAPELGKARAFMLKAIRRLL